jgi:hypothetical protein
MTQLSQALTHLAPFGKSQVLVQVMTIMTEVHRISSQSLQEDSEIMQKNSPESLPFTFVSVHDSINHTVTRFLHNLH